MSLVEDASPTLTDAQIDRLAKVGRRITTEAGDVLFAEGQAEYDLHVVLSGTLGVYDDVSGQRRPLLDQVGRGQFLGEMGLLRGEATFATAEVITAGEVLEVPRAAVVDLVASDPELSEIFLRAFAVRRQLSADYGSGLTIVGRHGGHSAPTGPGPSHGASRRQTGSGPSSSSRAGAVRRSVFGSVPAGGRSRLPEVARLDLRVGSGPPAASDSAGRRRTAATARPMGAGAASRRGPARARRCRLRARDCVRA